MAPESTNQPWAYGAGNTDSNGRVPFGGVIKGGKGQGIYEQSATPQYPLGYLVEFADGRRYRYAHFVAAVNRGVICAQDESLTCFGPIDGKATAAAIGATQVILTDTDTFGTAATAGPADSLYAGGYLFCEDDAGEGYIYRVKDSKAKVTAGVVTFDLYDPLVVALTTDSDVAGIGHKWKNVRIAQAGTDSIVCGVSVRDMTIAYYGFVQTRGPAVVLCEKASNMAIVRGVPAYLDAGTAGAACAIAGVASNTTFNAGDVDGAYVGTFLYTGTDTGQVGVDLCIE